MKIAISVETASDFSKELIKENDIKVVPFTVFLGDKDYKDGEITCDQIIEFVEKNKVLPKTGAVNRITYEEHFTEILKEYDGIIHISLSSELSSAYENALAVSKELKNVFVIDSRSLSTGIALLALYAKKLVSAGEKIESVYNKVLERVPNVSASFILKRVDYLYKGGRCNALVYLGANLLKIRPQIILKDGKMVSGKKYRGNFEHGVNTYCKDVLEEFNTPDLDTAFLTYTTASEEAIEIAKNHLINRGFKKVFTTRAGGTITSHCGENCLGILYINDGK
jgi:DegV family protein with EDD domain